MNWAVKCGFKAPNHVQQTIIPILESGKNVCLTSPTGTGKTHAFMVPIIQKIRPKKGLQAIILAPTSILSKQLFNVTTQILNDLESPLEVRRLSKKAFNDTSHEIIIATPFQLIDAVFNQALFGLKTVDMIILDEADMMLDQGFINELETIFNVLKDSVQIGVFSATMHPALLPLLKKSFSPLKVIDLNPKMLELSTLDFRLKYVEKNRRLEALDHLFKEIQPFFALVFCSSKEETIAVYKHLSKDFKEIGLLHGDLKVREREQLLKKAHAHKIQILVASDIAARGLDLPDISHVVNVSLPKDPSYFIHRIGRTARMGKEGISITFYEASEKPYFEKLKPYGFDIKQFGGRL